MTIKHWADALSVREEVVNRQGRADHLQMSLFDAVYQQTDVPYTDAAYWCDITEPAPRLVGLMADVTARLHGSGDKALYQLEQGMGGGKSHALVGLWHFATTPSAVATSDIGLAVIDEASKRGRASLPRPLAPVRTIVLCADHMTPGVPRTETGPAVSLHQRFCWGLVGGDRKRYDALVAAGFDKAALRDALSAVSAPVLILLDELMDYGQQLAAGSDESRSAEQAFLNSLFDVVDEVDAVCLVVVMISTDLDEAGYSEAASDFRQYVQTRLDRNTVTKSAINEPQDFGRIIRRRVFDRPSSPVPTSEIAAGWTKGDPVWAAQVLDKLPTERRPGTFPARLERSYPFHPDLLDLVERDWVRQAGFQRVRKTVEIFSATAYRWSVEHAAGRWAPGLIGVGDLSVDAVGDAVLSSGILQGNDKTIVAMRQVAGTDIVTTSRDGGSAHEMDTGRFADLDQPRSAERIATALWLYSLVERSHGKRGATASELLAVVFEPGGLSYADAEEVFNALVEPDDGLGALDVIPAGGNQPTRYVLSTANNLRMYHRAALNRFNEDDAWALILERLHLKSNAGGGFHDVDVIDAPDDTGMDLQDVFGTVDRKGRNRLVVLDPRRWRLLNGRDDGTRKDVEKLLGLGGNPLRIDFAATCVVACANTQRATQLLKRARIARAWIHVVADLDPSSDLRSEADSKRKEAVDSVDADLRRSFQHYAHLYQEPGKVIIDWRDLDDDKRSAINGRDVWDALKASSDAVDAGGLTGAYLHQVLDLSARAYTVAEVVDRFWRDPSLPLIPDDNEARRAIFDALHPDIDGVRWQLVDEAGNFLHVDRPDQLQIRGGSQYLQVVDASSAPDHTSEATDDTQHPDGTSAPPAGEAAHAGASQRPLMPRHEPSSAGPTEYRRQTVRIDPRSLTNAETRQKLWLLLSELSDSLDPATGADLQMIEGTITVTTTPGTLEKTRLKAADAGVTWLDKPDEPFG